jgi:hypothetical protein
MQRINKLDLRFTYEPEEEEDDLISYEEIMLHWFEQLMTMETMEELQELEEVS